MFRQEYKKIIQKIIRLYKRLKFLEFCEAFDDFMTEI